MRKNYHLPILLLCAASLITDCKKNDNAIPDSPSSTSDSNNQNDLSKSQYAQRLEMPRFSTGSEYQLLVKTTTTYGVNFTIEWNKTKRAQRWTCWAWTPENNVNPTGWTRKQWVDYTWQGVKWGGDPFQEDPELDNASTVRLAEYSGSGYSRGHICASADRISGPDVNGPTYYLSNMHPQISSFNSGVWQNMEEKVRDWAKNITNSGGTLYICKGGTIDNVNLSGKSSAGRLYVNPATNKPNNSEFRLVVPKYFFMALLSETKDGKYSAMAFWAEHKPDESKVLTGYVISVDELEKRTGIDFFCNLPGQTETAVESTVDMSAWKF